MFYYVYLLQSINRPEETYVGSTNNLRRRLAEHNNGKMLSTKPYIPWKVVAYEAYKSEEDARIREVKLKQHGNSMKAWKLRVKNSMKEERGSPSTTFARQTSQRDNPEWQRGNKGNNDRLRSKSGAGFTLIEMVVTVAIFGILTAVVLANYRGWENQNLLSSLAHEIALTVREAQTYGISVQSGTGDFGDSYGVRFDTRNSNNSSYFTFVDTGTNRGDPDGYNSNRDSVVQQFTLGRGYVFGAIHKVLANGDEEILEGNSRVDMVFTRPNPNAQFFSNGDVSNAQAIKVILTAPSGDTRAITVSNTGQIAVE